MDIVSYGGGTNSTAMIIGMYRRGMPIDLIVFSDTGGERPETYGYIRAFSAWLMGRGLPGIEIAQKTNVSGQAATLEAELLKGNKLPPPCYGTGECAVKYKLQPQEKYCNNHGGCRSAWKSGEKVRKYIGYDAGERRRIDKNQAKYDADAKYAYYFPLIGWGWGRGECVAAIREAGLPLPGKSSCFFCPNNRKGEIQKLWEDHPDLFDRAVGIERNARKTKPDGTPSAIVGLGRTWTWERYREEYEHQRRYVADHYVLPGFEDVTGGCCCGMPCGCCDG